MTHDESAPGADVPDPGGPIDLAAALESEHREVDAGIEEFLEQAGEAPAGLGRGALRPQSLRTAMEALRRHIYLEEEFLFPPIRAAGMVMPIMVMVREHGALWRAMDELDDELTGAPAEAAGQADRDRRDRILAGCRELLALLDRHNAKEEPIIYPRSACDLSDAERADLAEFLRRGRTPDGWVCQDA
jgi:hemerythrin-like domain-containing protein